MSEGCQGGLNTQTVRGGGGKPVGLILKLRDEVTEGRSMQKRSPRTP